MKSDGKELKYERVIELIEQGDMKMKASEEPVLSSKSSLIQDAIEYYKKAKEIQPKNENISQRLKKAEFLLKEESRLEKKEEIFSRKPK